MAHCFVALGLDKNGKNQKIKLQERTGSKNTGFQYKSFREVLWGDWLTVAPIADQADAEKGWLKIIWADKDKEKRKVLFIEEQYTTDKRPLEIVFVDVGKGDGAVLITPERDNNEAVIVIDAGENENMYKFLAGRFGTYGKKFQFHAAIITHPDQDHYLGFREIFSSPNVGFDVVYQNGLIERPGKSGFEKLGGLQDDKKLGTRVIYDLALGEKEIKDSFSNPSTFKRAKFAPVMHAALMNANIKDFKMLSTEHATKEGGRSYLPDFAPSDKRGYHIEVVGPVVESGDGGKLALRKISSYGKTKNGHSVLLRLNIGGFKIFFGGDLNKPAEKFLLTHYSGNDFISRKSARRSQVKKTKYLDMIKAARNWFAADVMKVCHHGAEDVTDEFMETVSPATFIISSGEDGYVHPRPDLLGRLGKAGRGDAPVILSTELQRGSRADEDYVIGQQLMHDIVGLKTAPTPKELKSLTAKIDEVSRSNVTVYGSIYVKTDGQDMLVAFKKETGSQVDKWFWFQYKVKPDGQLNSV